MKNIFLYSCYMSDQYEMDYEEYCETYKLKQITECPKCYKAVFYNVLCDLFEGGLHYILLECPNCHEIILVSWFVGSGDEGEIISIYPRSDKKTKFEETISDLSSNFVEVYNQAEIAEVYNLHEIAGMGYRKALEHLIKDYCIDKYPEDAEKIKRKNLSECIKNYIKDSRIKDMALRAVWLGNDETHYVRKWINKDINDMKKLIDLTLHWISYEILTEKYKEDMSST